MIVLIMFVYFNYVCIFKKWHIHNGKNDSEIKINVKRKIQMIKLWFISSLEELLYSPKIQEFYESMNVI